MPETRQINSGLEKVLLDIFRSEKKKGPRKGRKRQLKSKGITTEFAHLLACFEKANKRLVKFNPSEINLSIDSLIEEFKEAGFDKKIALVNPGRLRELKKLKLPVTADTICRNPQTLLENKQALERLKLPVTTATICGNPQTLLENKQALERLGLRVTASTICRNPQKH